MKSFFPLLAMAAPLLAAAPQFKLTTAKQDPPTELKEGLRKLLKAEAQSLADESGTASAKYWFRDSLPSTANAEQIKNGLTYQEIAPGSLLGAVQFEKAFTDYRKQEIAAGVYTLRLALQPEIGDHKETAPNRDFCILCPAASDESTEPLETKDLLALGRKATGGDHPAVCLLFPHRGTEAKLELIVQKDGAECLRLRIPVQTADAKTELGVSIVVRGVSKAR